MSQPSPRPRPLRLTVSVVVPCAARHVPLLPTLVQKLAEQTSRPDQVVVAISGVSRSPVLPLPTAICIPDRVARNAAQNRNRATPHVTSDVVLYQDADDVPHPQRVELVRALFERFEIKHLMHAFATASNIAWSDQRYNFAYASQLLTRKRAYNYEPGLTNGNPAVATSLLRLGARWPEHLRVGEDVAFNIHACTLSDGKNASLQLPLLLYRQHLSATSR